MYKYRHDIANRTVYRFPSEPTVLEQRDKKGNRTGWSVKMAIDITRADNKLNGSQWKHATSAYPSQQFDPHYKTKAEVVSYFLMRHAPDGGEITEEQYELVQANYEHFARTQ